MFTYFRKGRTSHSLPSAYVLKFKSFTLLCSWNVTLEYKFANFQLICQRDRILLAPWASTPYKRWSKFTMKKIGGRFLQELRGEVRKLFMHFPPKFTLH